MRFALGGAVIAVMLSGCGAVAETAGYASATRLESPQQGASPSPNAYAVMVDTLSSQSTYTISLVGRDGLVHATVQAARRIPIGADVRPALELPYVSTTLDALYYLDGDATVRMLPMAGLKPRSDPVTRLQLGAGMEGAFAVSPDDARIAVSVLDYNRTPVHVLLYVEDLKKATRQVIFESESDYVWPVAWHQGLLVLAHAYGAYVEDALKAAPAKDDPYWAVSYHVVDPATATREVLLGACTVSGPLSPAGSGCIQGGSIDWAGNTRPWSTHDWGSISAAASLSLNGGYVAAADPDNPARLDFWRSDGSIVTSIDGPGPSDWAGWLDDVTVVVGSATSSAQTRVVTLTSAGPVVVNVDAGGYYAARLPADVI